VRLRFTILALVALSVTACGGGLIANNPGTSVTGIDTGENVPLPELSLSDIEGTYTLKSVLFDGDSSKTFSPAAYVTTDLNVVTYADNGVPKDVKARIGNGYLIISSGGTYSFFYSFVDDKGALVSVGPFQSGSMSGKVVISGKNIGFESNQSSGLAADQETLYLQIKGADSLILEDVTQDTPSPHFGVLEFVKKK